MDFSQSLTTQQLLPFENTTGKGGGCWWYNCQVFALLGFGAEPSMALREVLRALESYFIYLPFYHTLIYFIGNGQCQLESGNLMDCLSLQGKESPFLLSFLQVLR